MVIVSGRCVGNMHSMVAFLFLISCCTVLSAAQSTKQKGLLSRYHSDIKPLLTRFCFDCHGAKQAQGSIDLESLRFDWRGIRKQHRLLEDVHALTREGDMPPSKAPQPSPQERARIVAWLQEVEDELAQERAGDPGQVVLRRLTAIEYLHTMRELTGVAMPLGEILPADVAGGEGFANVGSVQAMSDAILAKYLSAAKRVVTHAHVSPVLGIRFAPVAVPTDQKVRIRQAMDRIQNIYYQAYQDYTTHKKAGHGDYRPGSADFHHRTLLAIWQGLHADRLGLDPDVVPQNLGIAPSVVQDTWEALQAERSPLHPLFGIRHALQALPAPPSAADRRPVQVDERISAMCYRIVVDWAGMRKPKGTAKQRKKQKDPGSPQTRITRTFPRATAGKQVYLKVVAEGRTSSPVFVHLKADGLGIPVDAIDAAGSPVSTDKGKPTLSGTVRLQLPCRVPIRVPQNNTTVRVSLSLAPDLGEKPVLVFASLLEQPDDLVVWNIDWPPMFNAAGRERFNVLHAPLFRHFGDFTTQAIRKGPVSLIDGGWSLPSGGVRFHRWSSDFLYERHDERFLYFLPQFKQHLDEAWRELAYQHPPVWVRYRRFLASLAARLHASPAEMLRVLRSADMVTDEVYASISKEYSKSRIRFDNRNQHELLIDRLFSADGFAALSEALLTKGGRLAVAARTTEADRRRGDELLEEYQKIKQGWDDTAAALLKDFAERAWRRPVDDQQQTALMDIYRSVRSAGEEFDAAMRTVMVRILISPYFLYHWQRADKAAVTELGPHELANRLAYFLWTAPADTDLLAAARDGDLKEPGRQVRRLLADPRSAGFANEFFGSWFGYRGFTDHPGPAKDAFPAYTTELQHSLHLEVRHFFADLVRQDRSIDTILNGDHVFHDGRLRAHYGYQVQWDLLDQQQPRFQVDKKKDKKKGEGKPMPVYWRDDPGEGGGPMLSFGSTKKLKSVFYGQACRPTTFAAGDRVLIACARSGERELRGLTITFRIKGKPVGVKQWRPIPTGQKVSQRQRQMSQAGISFLPSLLPRWTMLAFDPAEVQLNGKSFDELAILVEPGGLDIRYIRVDASKRGFERRQLVAEDPRHGILGMGAMLTLLSTPQRSSPIKRGTWILEKLLDRRLPPPPNNVPDLPEVRAGGQNQRELLRAHREDPNCASCHSQIDPLGLCLEPFDLVGRLRQMDVNGQPIVLRNSLADGRQLDGVNGLRAYLVEHRQQFRHLFCRKLLGFALGRAVLPGDKDLIQDMERRLAAAEGRISVAVEAIVTSSQFRLRRNTEETGQP